MDFIYKHKFSCIPVSFFISLILIHEMSAATCAKKDLVSTYLETAINILGKAKDYTENYFPFAKPQDCDDVLNLGFNKSGIYRIWPKNRVMKEQPVEVYCDMDTDGGGWTLIQRRGNFQRAVDYFYKNWESYKKGFGDLDKDFWLGNDIIFAISNQKEYSARFDLTDVEGVSRYAHYDFFWIDDENHKYMLHVKDYRGDAGDSLSIRHDGMKFSTKDQRNDNYKNKESCAESFKGAWWYYYCHESNLNGLYLRGKHDSYANGVNWKTFKGFKESLEATEIKLRPKYSKRNHQKSSIFE